MYRSIVLLLVSIALLFAIGDDSLGFDMNELTSLTTDSLLTTTSTPAAETEASSPIFMVVLRIVGSLTLISALIVGVVWLLKKTGVAGTLPVPEDSPLELLDELPIGPGTSVILVRFGDKVHLLGQGSSSINPIDSVEGEEAKELIASRAGGKSVGTFRANLNKYVMSLQKGGKNG